MGQSVIEAPAAPTQQPASGRRVAGLSVGALLAGFVLSAALTALLAAEQRQTVGEWGAIGLFAAGALPLAVIDARTRRLPNLGTIPLAAALLGYWTGLAATTGQWQLLTQAVLATGIIVAIVTLSALIGTLAAGDLKLFLAIGLLTGWFSWLLPVYALAAAYILTIPHATIILMRKRAGITDDTRFPFGPYLVAAPAIVTALTILVTR